MSGVKSETNTKIVLTGTFVLDPAENYAQFLANCVDVPTMITAAPFGQLFQQLIDPLSALRRNVRGTNALCVRWSDIAPKHGNNTADDWRAIGEELATTLKTFEQQAPFLMVICPEAGRDLEMLAAGASAAFSAALDSHPNVFTIALQDWAQLYKVEQVFDHQADQSASMPYSDEAYAAMAALIMRWHLSAHRRPVKMIVSDCDNTLWRGVLGEDGADHIEIDAGAQMLQHMLVHQSNSGKIIALASKNDERDVLAVLSDHPAMVLRPDHILAHEINWAPKPQNVQAMAERFGVGEQSVVFLDDSAVEIGANARRLRGGNFCSGAANRRINSVYGTFLAI